MKLSQTRQAIVEEWKENMRIGLGLDDEDVEVAKNHFTNALNDYTEEIQRMVEEMKLADDRHKDMLGIGEGLVSYQKAYNQALSDIKEELNP